MAYDKRIFAKNLQYYMDKNGEKPADIMNLLKVGKSSVSSWINAVKVPRVDKLQILANHWGIALSDLMDEPIEDKKESPSIPDELTEEIKHIIELYDNASPEIQAAALAVLKSGGQVPRVPDASEANE